MDKKSFCPFINGSCRNDCMFNYNAQVAVGHGSTVCCSLAIQASNSNEMQHDQLSEIINLIEK